MDIALYCLVRPVVFLLQHLPLSWVVRIGRFLGGAAYWIDRRHRQVALKNLSRSFQREKDPAELIQIARENFRRLGENYAAAVKTVSMTSTQIQQVLSVSGLEKLTPPSQKMVQNRVLAVGHFGNFELYARASSFVPGIRFATTYRGLRHPRLNKLLFSLRAQSGCLLFERRTEVAALKAAMQTPGLFVGFLCDQHAGRTGAHTRFFNIPCSTTPAPALFALRYRLPLNTAICYRVAPGKWHIEVGDEIPTRTDGKPRAIEEITQQMNDAFEAAVRRDPANWFWVHERWKPLKPRRKSAAATPSL